MNENIQSRDLGFESVNVGEEGRIGVSVESVGLRMSETETIQLDSKRSLM